MASASTEEANKITNSLAMKEAATNAFTNEVVTGLGLEWFLINRRWFRMEILNEIQYMDSTWIAHQLKVESDWKWLSDVAKICDWCPYLVYPCDLRFQQHQLEDWGQTKCQGGPRLDWGEMMSTMSYFNGILWHPTVDGRNPAPFCTAWDIVYPCLSTNSLFRVC